MAYVITDERVGHQQIADISTTQKHPLGTIIRATDPTYGEGEFIYLLGVTGTVAGSWVTYAGRAFTTALIVANAIGPVAIAMAANVGSSYGWYLIQGAHPAAIAGDVASNGNLYAEATAGKVDDAIVTGDRVWGAKATAADNSTHGTVAVEIHRPFMNDALNAGTS
jgi:hypothetical protein